MTDMDYLNSVSEKFFAVIFSWLALLGVVQSSDPGAGPGIKGALTDAVSGLLGDAPPEAGTAVNRPNLSAWIEYYARQYGVDVYALKALCQSESAYGVYLTNTTDPYGGAFGPFQFLLPTARVWAGKVFNWTGPDAELKAKLMTDAQFSAALGAANLAALIAQTGGLQAAIWRYKGAVSDAGRARVWGIYQALYSKYQTGVYV